MACDLRCKTKYLVKVLSTVMRIKWFWLKNDCFSLNIRNSKNDTTLFSLRNMKIMPKLFSAGSLVCGPIFDNSENNP